MIPVRRMMAVSGKSSLSSGIVSPFCHWALDEEISVGNCSAFAVRASPSTLLRSSTTVLVSRVLAIKPIWWSMSRTMLLSTVGLWWPNRPLGASICRCDLVRERPAGDGAYGVDGAISHFGASLFWLNRTSGIGCGSSG